MGTLSTTKVNPDISTHHFHSGSCLEGSLRIRNLGKSQEGKTTTVSGLLVHDQATLLEGPIDFEDPLQVGFTSFRVKTEHTKNVARVWVGLTFHLATSTSHQLIIVTATPSITVIVIIIVKTASFRGQR